jgi:hypothetical protein
LIKQISTSLCRWTVDLLVGLLIIGLLGGSITVEAATNQAVDPGGGGVSLNPSGLVTVNSVNLALVKQARDLAGTVLPGGSNVSPSQQIYFVLYVDNSTITSAIDIRIADLLNESQFTYVPNSIETTVVPTGSNDAAIWGGVWTALTDGILGPDDLASITDTGGPAGLDRVTIGAVAGQANRTLNVPGGSLRAIRFRVTVN